MDQILINSIHESSFLSDSDKDFLVSRLTQMSPIEKLKLKHKIASGQIPEVLQILQQTRVQFFESEKPKEKDLITKIAQTIFKPEKPKPVSTSLLASPQLLGTNPPQPIIQRSAPNFGNLSEFQSLEQLFLLNNNHLTLEIANWEQIFNTFLTKLETLFEKCGGVAIQRNYFMTFLQSPLFGNYINTGLTALRHPELQPTTIILNILYQIDNKNLNGNQFKFAALLCNHLRSLCSL